MAMRKTLGWVCVAVVGLAGVAGTVGLSTASESSRRPVGGGAGTSGEVETVVAEDEDAHKELILEPPPAPPELPVSTADTDTTAATDRTALAYQFNSPVYGQPDPDANLIGFVRRNTRVAVARWVPGSGCDGSSWYEIFGGGYVCGAEGFHVQRTTKPLPEDLRSPAARIASSMPFRYAKVGRQEAPRYWRLPTPEEQARANASDALVAPVRERLRGAVFVALDRWVEDEGRRFVRTVKGRYLQAEDVQPRSPPAMHGERLEGNNGLPIAFVHGEDAPIRKMENNQPVVVGQARKHARFPVLSVVEIDGRSHVQGPNGIHVPRDRVRVAERIDRPDDVPAGARWIHVDLGQQTLVAYEGEAPVLATLVSTGKEGHEPPLGLFRVHKKYVTRTMSGEDEVDGYYEVDQVPWTMYYWGSYALHGAYWHDAFGTVRSHGCTNIPPIDAQWLFYWSEPEVPTGWHGVVGRRGPHVYFSDSSLKTRG